MCFYFIEINFVLLILLTLQVYWGPFWSQFVTFHFSCPFHWGHSQIEGFHIYITYATE